MQTATLTSSIARPSRIGEGLIGQWLAAVAALTGDEAGRRLRDLYGKHRPRCTGLIFTGACEFQCQHCIYPQDYGRANGALSVEQWVDILAAIVEELKTPEFFYGGRAVTEESTRVLARLRTIAPRAAIGLVDNAISMLPYLEKLEEAKLDWIDLSFDGTREAHDAQRGRSGSFDVALKGGLRVMAHRLAPRLSVLTCVTSLNAETVGPMIRDLHGHGFRNFFLIPVTVVAGRRPSERLAVSATELACVLDRCSTLLGKLDDLYVELAVFDSYTLSTLHSLRAWRGELRYEDDHMVWAEEFRGGLLTLRYWPGSLNGLREFIVNTNGEVILPKSMAWGVVPPQRVLGNLLKERPRDVWQRVPEMAGFEEFLSELTRERCLLRPVIDLLE